MFIVFEGVDNVGKTTQLNLLAKSLKKSGCDVIIYRDLTVFNKEGFIKLNRLQKINFITNQRAAYARALKEYSRSGGIVLLDRFIDSTIVYQGETAADVDLVLKNHRTMVGIKPDLCLTFALLSNNNFAVSGASLDDLDKEYELKRDEYNQKFIANSYSKNRLIINSALTIEEAHELINVSVRRNSTFIKLYVVRRCKNRALLIKK